MPDSHHTYDVFISYARQDGLDRAAQLERDLHAAGFTTWRDTRNLDPNQDFTAELERAIERCARVVCCITPDTRRDNSFVRREIAYALALNKPVIPVIFEDTLPPIHIINVTREDFTHTPWEVAVAALITRLRSADTDAQQPVTPPDDPYRAYLNALYRQIVSFLKQTVFSEITLHSASTPGAVEHQELPALPVAFWGMSGLEPDPTPKMFRTFENFSTAFEQFDGRVLLLGEPGAGKTTTLFAFARDKVAARLQDPALPLPILAPIATWDPDKQTPLAEWLASLMPVFTPDVLKHLIDAGTALLLLDGLDELGHQRDENARDAADPRALFMDLIPLHTPVIVTCRQEDYQEIDRRIALNGAITLQPLNDDQIRAYLHDVPALWSALQADDDLRAVARTPLLLSLFTVAYRDHADDIGQLRDLRQSPRAIREQIFQSYVQRSYEREVRKHAIPGHITLDLIHTVLGQIAARILRWSGRGQKIRAEHWLAHYPHPDVEQFIDTAINLHLLVTDGDVHRFKHLFLRDYFATSYGLHVLTAQDQAVALSDDSVLEALKVFGALQDERATQALIDAAFAPSTDLRQRAVKALGYLGGPDAFAVLQQKLDDEDRWVRHSALKAFGVLRDERAVDVLVQLVHDGDPRFAQQIIADALGHIGNMAAVPVLIALLETGNDTTRKSAAQALGRLRALVAVDVLLAALDDPNERVRQDAILALGAIGDARAVMPIIDAYYREDSDTRRCALEALGHIGDPLAVPVLIDALHDHASYIRPFAVQALERIGTSEARAAVAEWRAARQESDQ